MTDTPGAGVMLGEIDRLPEDLPRLVEGAAAELFLPASAAFFRPFDEILLTGCGDSLQAAAAVVATLAELSGRPAQVIGPRRLAADLASDGKSGTRAPMTGRLVIGISASGATPAVYEALEGARVAGAATLAIVGQADSPVEQIASQVLVLPLADRLRSPGIRTYQASLVGLLTTAIRLGVAAGRLNAREADRWYGWLTGSATLLRQTIEASAPMADRIAEETARFPVMLFLAAGPHLATARYAAAKRIEASGLYAAGQDLEEAWHVERFAAPSDLPVAVIAPPGPTVDEAAQAALNARRLGRQIYTLSARGALAVRRHADLALDLAPAPVEALAPLVCHPVFTLVAAREALLLGRRPFSADTTARQAGRAVSREGG